jgi:hypothetical protein
LSSLYWRDYTFEDGKSAESDSCSRNVS